MNGIMDQIGALGGKISDALGLGEDKQPDMSQKLNELIKSSGGLGGLLGSAAIGGLLGTLLSGKACGSWPAARLSQAARLLPE